MVEDKAFPRKFSWEVLSLRVPKKRAWRMADGHGQ